MIEKVVKAVLKAGEEVLKIYEGSFSVTEKEDRTPLTEADTLSHGIITQALKGDAPVISEEGDKKPDSLKNFWLVDPLDGTKEFIKRNGDFTINVAFIEEGKPKLGVVYAPALGKLYSAEKGKRARLLDLKEEKEYELPLDGELEGKRLKVVVSRSHADEKTEEYIKRLSERFEIERVSVGSSLKICLLAEGKADLYPRTGPTMEWDTAAAHAVLLETGGALVSLERGMFCDGELLYGKEGYRNPPFLRVRSRSLLKEVCP